MSGPRIPPRLLLDEAIRMVRTPLPFSSFMLDNLDSLLFRSSYAIRCSFTFDPDNFPDPKAYLSEIKEKYGVKICVWSASLPFFLRVLFHLSLAPSFSYSPTSNVLPRTTWNVWFRSSDPIATPTVNPYISQLSPIFQEAVKGGYLIKRKDGTPWQYVYSVLFPISIPQRISHRV